LPSSAEENRIAFRILWKTAVSPMEPDESGTFERSGVIFTLGAIARVVVNFSDLVPMPRGGTVTAVVLVLVKAASTGRRSEDRRGECGVNET
jgi:hypothetical protein